MKRVIRATWDSNVLVGALPSRNGPLADLRRAWRDERFTLVVSEHVLTEADHAWRARYWQQRVPPEMILLYLEAMQSTAGVVPIAVTVLRPATHPDDDLVRAPAISGQAAYLVTGDGELLALRSFQSVAIVSPRQFPEVLRL